MVSFSKLGKMGRLGNQLWQISSVMGIAEHTNQDAAFPQWEYQQYFEPQLPSGSTGAKPYKEPFFHYDENVLDEKDSDLIGYFQSAKYFGSTIPRFRKDYLEQQRAKLPKGENIAIHIRRGDYVGHEAYAQLPVTYFIKALLSIENWQDKNILLFSDDMGYCKTHFECLPNAHFIKGNEVEHLAMMSLCDEHVLSNSSYSWWGAYLSEQKNVIYPKEYFRGSYSNKSTKDLWPDNWTEFWPEDMKLDCTDLTFTIPVMFDSPDRKKNIDLGLCHLQKHINAKYIIGECKTGQFEYLNQWAQYIHYPYTTFHRTKMLNDMAEKAETPYIANWDCDIFIPPLQIWSALQKLRSGGQMVYPYDGRFARMDRFPWFKKIESTVDIGTVSDNTLSGRAVKESFGGAVFWNKEAFTEYGCENEYMVSYAPEDVERYERAFKLGCKIEMTPGALYHMDHFRGPDSSNRSPHFAKSSALLATYRKMTADELRKEVDTWAWRHQYTPQYYERFIQSAQQSAKCTYDRLASLGYPFAGKSIIDVGCGVGEWALNSSCYLGIDYGVSKKNLLITEDQYRNWDLTKEMYLPSQQFSLCICLEVAEHLEEKYADKLINYLCSLSDFVLFSAAIPAQGGTGHCNEQFQAYWAEKFYKNGFGAELCYPVKDNPNVCLWYRQNMILYRKGATGKVYNFILPEYYEQIILHRDNQIQELSDRCASLMKKVA